MFQKYYKLWYRMIYSEHFSSHSLLIISFFSVKYTGYVKDAQ